MSHSAAENREGGLAIADMREWHSFAWSFLYFFALLTGYYVLRPVRDAMGAESRLELLFSATFVCMLLLTPLYGALVSRYPRRAFLPLVYAFFIACLVALHFAFSHQWSWRGPVFFVWVAVFNLFTVSVFWSFMSDVFDHGQAKRLFGAIAAGGTIGGFLGPLITSQLAVMIGVANLLLISAALLGVCMLCIVQLIPAARAREQRDAVEDGDEAMGGTVLAGVRLIRESRLLQAMCLLMFCGIGVGTLLYNEQAAIARAGFADAATRTAYYARIDLAINVLTITLQVLVTRWLLVRYGLKPTMLLPAFAVLVGFFILTASPLPLLVAVVQVCTRAGEFALLKPSRESVYTRVDREMRYKAKNFIDTVVYRGSDLTFVWLHKGLVVLGLGSSFVFGVGVLLAIGLVFAVLWLVRMAETLGQGPAPANPPRSDA